MEGNTLVAHDVNTGMSDGSHTQIISGLKEGQQIIVGVKEQDDNTEDEQQARSPFAPGPPNKKKKN